MTHEAPYLVDSHCHLDFEGLIEDLDGVIARAREANVLRMLAINTRLSTFERLYGLAEGYPEICCSVGVHPHEAENEPDTGLEALLERAARPEVVAIGESGLDYYYDNAPRDQQQINFKTHIKAAQESGLPIIVHSREAEGDTLGLLEAGLAAAPYTGVIHCFTASQAFAEAALKMGFYISLSGIVTFKNAADIQATAKTLPMERLLVETDSPYLAPVPVRGRPCEPAFVAHTAAFVAGLKGIEPEQLARQTTENFYTLFSKAERL
ncbi:MAG: TatD family hydrolase [Proteobacteria bacterium]|nr:TatD family hydrolase [Pseudomonadota bacterium]